MKLFLFLIISLFLFSCASSNKYSRSPKSLEEIEYLDRSDELISKSHSLTSLQLDKFSNKIDKDLQKSCPSKKVANKCGNGTCDVKVENGLNCPIDCSPNLIRAYNKTMACYDTERLYFPKNEKEVKEVILWSKHNGKKVRFIGAKHSANSVFCSKDVGLSSKYFNKILGIEKRKEDDIVRVQGGVTIGAITDFLHKKNYSLGVSIPSIRGATVAGSISTGSHGGSVKYNTLLSSKVVSLKIVMANGDIKVFRKDNTSKNEWGALTAGLGRHGFISELALKLEPQFNLDTTFKFSKDSLLFNGKNPAEAAAKCDYSHIYWWPIKGKIANLCGVKTAKKAHKNARITTEENFVPAALLKPVKAIFHRAACYKTLTCLNEALSYSFYRLQSPMVRKGLIKKTVHKKKVIGPSHKMIASNFGKANYDFPVIAWELTIPYSKSKAALKFIKKAFKKKKCNPLLLTFMRFSPVDDSTLVSALSAEGEFKVGEPALVLEFIRYQPQGYTDEIMSSYDEWMNKLFRDVLTKFKARSHWGKSKDWVFKYQNKLGHLKKNRNLFNQVTKRFDPEGVFSNQFLKGAGIE